MASIENAKAIAARLNKATDVIPTGDYCYVRDETRSITNDASGMPRIPIKVCPYWASNPSQKRQNDGFCAYLGYGDWEERTLSLLWDQVKECGVNPGPDPDEG